MVLRRLLTVGTVAAVALTTLAGTTATATANSTARWTADPAATLARGQARLFAKIPPPGQPEGIAVDPADGSVWSGSNRAGAVGVVWHHSADGRLLRRYHLFGHSPRAEHGVNGIALDGDGLVYALDWSGARIVRIEPVSGRQGVYARFPDLPSCGRAAPGSRCEPGDLDRQAWPNWATFAPDGTLYVSDLNQSTIWAVPRGGGPPRIWFQDPSFFSLYSLNGMQLDAAGRLVFVLTVSAVLGPDLGNGILHRIAVRPDGGPGRLERLGRVAIADGLAIGRSGRIYVASAAPGYDRVQVVSPGGAVLDALPHRDVQAGLAVPLDTPASLAFRGTELLVTNHALTTGDPAHFAILALGVGEPGLSLHHPRIGPLRPRPAGVVP